MKLYKKYQKKEIFLEKNKLKRKIKTKKELLNSDETEHQILAQR